MQNIYVTFDIDMCNYGNEKWIMIDEFENCFEDIKKILAKYKEIKTTWFIRIDENIKEIYGEPEYIFNKYKNKIEWLKDNNHEIGWHYHSYVNNGGKWKQNIDENIILNEIKRYGKIALLYGIKSIRMGWGYHTNKTIELVNKLGFKVDSSAIPRPKYKWDKLEKNWEITSINAYNPSKIDYRIETDDNHKICELPITTTKIKTSYDEEENILRYINPAYKKKVFQKAIEQVSEFKNVVLIMHPYEISEKYKQSNELISFSIKDFEENLKFIIDKKYNFKKISEIIMEV